MGKKSRKYADFVRYEFHSIVNSNEGVVKKQVFALSRKQAKRFIGYNANTRLYEEVMLKFDHPVAYRVAKQVCQQLNRALGG